MPSLSDNTISTIGMLVICVAMPFLAFRLRMRRESGRSITVSSVLAPVAVLVAIGVGTNAPSREFVMNADPKIGVLVAIAITAAGIGSFFR